MSRFRVSAVLAAAVIAVAGVGFSGSAAATPPPAVNLPVLFGMPCTYLGDLTEFYTAPAGPITAAPGTLIRCQERLDIQGLTGARAYRVMYVSEAPAAGSYVPASRVGSRTIARVKRYSTGMIFIPRALAPVTGRKIVAWDHGTVGMGQTCAPSISGYKTIAPVTPTSKSNTGYGFVQNMLNNNWVVTATDYAGLGIIGQSTSLQYLVGQSEAMDTVNAVRMAVAFPGSSAKRPGRKPVYAVYGQSQGGHAALFTGSVSPTYAPELTLTSVVASDPAAAMVPLVQQQYNKLIAWVLGPEVAIAWPGAQPSLNAADVLTVSGQANTQTFAAKCISAAALAALAIDPLGRNPFFLPAVNSNPAWVAMQQSQTPPVVTGLPVLVGQAQNDGVVLANTTASLQRSWCTAGSNLSMFWVKPSGLLPFTFIPMAQAHLNSASVDALAAISFITNGFNGKPVAISGVTPCNTPPPTPLS